MKSHNLTNANSGSETLECFFVSLLYQGKIDPTYDITAVTEYLLASSSSCISIYWLEIKNKLNKFIKKCVYINNSNNKITNTFDTLYKSMIIHP